MVLVERSGMGEKYKLPRKKITYSDLFSDKMMMIAVIRSGISYSFFNLLQNLIPFNEKEWSELLEISTKSLQRYKQSAKTFKPTQSEKIIEMAEVTNLGVEVFGTMDKFRLWLETPNFSLGNSKPMELLKDSYGKELVMSELTRINYGILA